MFFVRTGCMLLRLSLCFEEQQKKHGKSRSPFPCFLILAAIARIPQQYKAFLVSAKIKDQILYIRFNDRIDCHRDFIDC